MKLSSEWPTKEGKWARADSTCLSNTVSLSRLDKKLRHLDAKQGDNLMTLMRENKSLFTDVPQRHKSEVHEEEVRSRKPIKQSVFRVSPEKRKLTQQEVEYLLTNDLEEPSNSEWSSPCVLVKKGDESYHFSTDYRKVNSITVSDSHHMPRVSDCVDQVGNAENVSEVDLLKGYYQIPLSPSAMKISVFVTMNG